MTGQRLQEVKNLVKSCYRAPRISRHPSILTATPGPYYTSSFHQVHITLEPYTMYFRIFNQIIRSCRIAKDVAYTYIDAQCATVSPLSVSVWRKLQYRLHKRWQFINLLVVQYGSSQSVSYSKRGQACILEIALKTMVVKKKVFKNPYVTRGA